MADTMERMRELTEILNEASRAYYQEDREIMSNLEYDRLYDELGELERSSGIVLSGSPTRRVGYEVLGGLEKVPHESPMLSLDKTKEVSKLESFLAEQAGISGLVALLSWKLDGLTIVLKYTDGELVQAVTRGNGLIGADITHNARTFRNIPLKINAAGKLLVRGEAVIGYSEFERINSSLSAEEQYKNPRNLCSGTVRQLNSEIAASRNVDFFAFSVVTADSAFELKSHQLEWLGQNGFETVKYRKVTTDDVRGAVGLYEQEITENDYASDGLVLTYDDISYSESLGATSKFPRDSIAFKWSDDICETTLMDIEWNTSRTGLINPVAIFEPVELMGTTVNRASLHNVSIVKDLELGPGDRITVYKANMIIPQVAENLTRSGTAVIPESCGVCGAKTEIEQRREVAALYCTNPNCRAQLVRALTHFASRDAMNIEGLSQQTIEKFAARGFLANYIDIFTLYAHDAEIKEMEGFGEKSAANLLAAIEKSKETRLPNFIYALGINHVGLSNAKLLCRHFAYDIQKIKEAGKEELECIEGFGEIIAASLCDYFLDARNLELFERALGVLRIETPVILEAPAPKAETPVFVITGDLTRFANRKELQAYIEERGGKVTGSVSAKTSYLVNNDTTSESSKNKKAKSLNIPVINEDELIELFNEGAR